MAVKKSQEPTKYDVKQATIRAALQLDTEADVYRAEEEAGLTAQQWQAVALLVAGKRGVEVAEALGVTQETVSRWRNSPMFAAALNQALRDAYSASIGEIRSLVKDAVAGLRQCLRSEDEKILQTTCMGILRLHLELDSTAPSLPVTPADIARKVQMKDFNDAMFFG